MDMSYGRLAGVRGRSAVIAGALAGSCMAAVPSALLELVFSSLGLSELVPVLGPPVGWPVRTALVVLCALAAAAITGSREKHAAEGGRVREKEKTIMGWTQNLGLHHLVRIARGETGPAAEPTATARRSAEDKARDMLARRRADMHPDAPPRAPLVASRDLPRVAELTLVETAPTPVHPSVPSARPATPIRDTTDRDRPRPLPRTPEPLSDSDLRWVRDLLEGGNREIVTAGSKAPSTVAGSAAPAAPADSSPLLTLVDRFEQGVAGRIVLRDAADAQARLQDASDRHVPIAVAPRVSPAEASNDAGMDAALTAALETLRRLSVKANGR